MTAVEWSHIRILQLDTTTICNVQWYPNVHANAPSATTYVQLLFRKLKDEIGSFLLEPIRDQGRALSLATKVRYLVP